MSISEAKKKPETVASEGAVKPTSSPSKVFPIVGIGASAGGLEAFLQLLGNLPEKSGMAFVLVQHLDPNHESHLSNLLSKATRIPVSEVTDGTVVVPDHAYVIPPATQMTLTKGTLRLAPRQDTDGVHLPIDAFFHSLSTERENLAIGVILSGSGSDGCQGLAEIKAAGGITLVQEPQSAKFRGMPQCAIEQGLGDFVLPPEAIGKEIGQIARHRYLAPPEPGADEAPESADARTGFARIITLLWSATQVNFSHYRDTTLKRRIHRRMALHRLETLKAYIELLQQTPEEVQALYNDFLINVTRFFREPEVFEALKTSVFPEIVKGKSPRVPIRIWVTGCATGQEAYSLAIVLTEFLSGIPNAPPFQIFASDLSETVSLDKARQAYYPASIESEVSPERLQRFFTKEERGYRVNKDLRNRCVFARHNLAADPPFSRVDLISCRNVLIYMSTALQRKVLPLFHYALNPGGYLLLGASETVGRDSDLFEAVDRDLRIYTRRLITARLPHFDLKDQDRNANSLVPQLGLSPMATPSDFQREADRLVLARFAPAGVLVNADLEILQFRGKTDPFLELPRGEASFNLLKMAHDSLFLELRSAVQEAQTLGEAVHRRDLRVKDDGRIRHLDLEVIPVTLPISRDICYLLLFLESQPAQQLPAEVKQEETQGTRLELAEMRKESAGLREYLLSIRSQYDAAIEELRSSNEELLSSNEEMQSTNEELETAKEEYQSANEELTTVNEEMATRNQEMTLLNNDLNNLLNSMHVPIVILDDTLRIRRFTQAAGRALHLLASDNGRPLGDIRHGLQGVEVERLAREVMATALPATVEARDRDGRWTSLRIHGYRTADNRIDGAVIILMDVDAIKQAQEKQRESEEYARAIVETIRQPLLILRADLRVNSGNASFYRTFNLKPEETEGRPLYQLGEGQWDSPDLRKKLLAIIGSTAVFQTAEITADFPGIGPRTLHLDGRKLQRDTSEPAMILLAMEDVTDRQRAREILHDHSRNLEQAVRDRTAELRESTSQMEAFSYSVSHDLRAPLRAMQGYAETLLQDWGDNAPSEARAYMEKIIQNGSRMDRLILDVLTYSRTTLSQLQLGPVDLERLVGDLLRQHPEFQSPRAEIAVKSPLAPVKGHEATLAQCLFNLLQNAVKFALPGKTPDVVVRTETLGDTVRLWVADKGIGIPPEDQEKIFGMFEKGRSGAGYPGNGIGLAIVRKAVDRMGGRAGVESELGQGSRFWIELPARKEAR